MAAQLDPRAFERVDIDAHEAEVLDRPPITFWSDVWRRFLQNRLALAGLAIMAVLAVLAIIGPSLTGIDYRVQDYSSISQPPSSQYWFGTDPLGRDIFTRVWIGARISIFIAVVATLIDLVVGVVYGAISGYYGGKVDDVMMRIVDVLYGIPYLLMAILLMTILGRGLWSIILAMAATGWVGMARLVRGQVLQLKEQEFVLAARTLGAGTWRIMMKHLVPNMMGIILVNLTLTIPNRIYGEAFLSFIGLGVPAPMSSLGVMVNEAYAVFRIYPEQLVFPGAVIVLIMFAFNVIGDGLRDAIDPRLRM